MLHFEIVYYQNSRGEEPVREFLNGLNPKVLQKVDASLCHLEEYGYNLRRPTADYIGGKIYELRIQFAKDKVRILYFFFHGNQIVLLHGFLKREWKIQNNDIALAKKRMEDWIVREGK